MSSRFGHGPVWQRMGLPQALTPSRVGATGGRVTDDAAAVDSVASKGVVGRAVELAGDDNTAFSNFSGWSSEKQPATWRRQLQLSLKV